MMHKAFLNEMLYSAVPNGTCDEEGFASYTFDNCGAKFTIWAKHISGKNFQVRSLSITSENGEDLSDV